MIGKQFFPSSSLRSIFPCVRLPLGNRLKRRKPLKIQASRLRSATERRTKKGAKRDSKSVGGDTVWVRVPPPAPGPEPSLVERLRSFSFPRLQTMEGCGIVRGQAYTTTTINRGKQHENRQKESRSFFNTAGHFLSSKSSH